MGLNHVAAPVEVRERLAFSDAHLDPAYRLLLDGVDEGVILSTCNRTEVYITAGAGCESDAIAGFLADFHGVPLDSFRQYLYVYAHRDAVWHLFSVAAGIDSMILGEPQILGQVRDAYTSALGRNAAGRVLSQLFRQAISLGKLVRTETEISRNAVSVSYAAVELGRKIFGDLRNRMILIVGAGKMGELAAKTLIDVGVGSVAVVNRTRQRAEELAARFEGSAADFSDLPRLLTMADIVISSTGAQGFVIDAGVVAQAMRARRQRPLFLIDIAVPRDVDPAVQHLENVYLYNVDDLQAVCASNLREREKEIARVKSLISSDVEKFHLWLDQLAVVPTISALRDRAERIRQGELAKAYAKLAGLSEDERDTINALTQAIVNKMLHQPIMSLKGTDGQHTERDLAGAVRHLFGLDDKTP